MEHNRSRSKCPFFRLFFAQLFEIGNSAGSLIGEAINLFRIFQRLSVTKTFTAKFSKECLDMFKWATELVEISISLFEIKPFSDLELFSVYSISIPLLILTFIPALFNGYKQFRYYLIDLCMGLIGLGFGYIEIFYLGALIYLPLGFGLLLLISLLFYCYKRKNLDKNDGENKGVLEAQNTYQFTSASLASAAVFLGLSIPILKTRLLLLIILATVFGLVIIISFIVETSQKCCCSQNRLYHFKKVSSKIVALLINCLSLLIIPSTECFIKIMKGYYPIIWPFILSYIGVTIIFPIVTNFFLIKTNYSEICDKYKESKCCKFN